MVVEQTAENVRHQDEIGIELDRHCANCAGVFTAYVSELQPSRVRTPGLVTEAMQRDAALLVRLAPCPQCGARERAAVRSYLFALVGGIAVSATMGLISLLVILFGRVFLPTSTRGPYYDRNTPGFYLYGTAMILGMGLGGASLAWFVIRQAISRWRGSRNRVRFLEPTKSSEQQGPYRSSS